MTEAELAEGRYRLEKYGDSQDPWTPLDQWMWEHRHALLARREEIAREAVRCWWRKGLGDATEILVSFAIVGIVWSAFIWWAITP